MYQQDLLIRFSTLIRDTDTSDKITMVTEGLRTLIEEYATIVVADQTDVTVTSEIV